jgi:hypothetical protein
LQVKTLVDTVPTPASPSAFPGLWLDNLPRECWGVQGQAHGGSEEEDSLYVTSMWASRAVVLRIDAGGCCLSINQPSKQPIDQLIDQSIRDLCT